MIYIKGKIIFKKVEREILELKSLFSVLRICACHVKSQVTHARN